MDNINFGVHIGGAVPSKKERRDVVHKTLDVAPPVSYDSGYGKIPVQMQGKLGICTAEAVCTLIERFRNDGVRLSRRWTYVVGKKLVDGNLDEGSSIKSMLHGAYKYGTKPETVVPTDVNLSYADFVNLDVSDMTGTTTIPGYTNVLTDKSSIASGIYKYGGVAVRFDLGEEWYTDIFGNVTWDAGKILPLRAPKNIISGHAVVATGYDFTNDQKTTYRNSWSGAWALNGDGYSFLEEYSPTEAYGILSVPPVIVNVFTSQMGYGSMGPQVYLLQKQLISDRVATFSIPTGFFGPKTLDSVKKYQGKYGIPQTGYVGPLTLAQLNRSI